jgi:GntR family histidine utilization transcriptional repressor
MNEHIARYTQVKNYVLAGISDGSWGTGERVPSENELVDLCNVSRMTARRALQELLLEGTLVRIKGKGSFVAQEKQQSSLLQINSIANEIRQQGHTHRSALIKLETTEVTSEIAETMKVSVNSKIYLSKVLHYQNDVPIQLEHRWVIPDAAVDYINQNFIDKTPSEYLTEIAPVTEAEHKIEAVIGDYKYRDLLQVGADEALLLLKRTTWCGSQLVSFAKLYHPGNRYSFGTRFNQP